MEDRPRRLWGQVRVRRATRRRLEPMLTIPEDQPGAGGYREHDILIITETGNEDITKYPYGPEFNIVG